MTDPVATPVAKSSILATLLADLKAIEDNFHGLADPQLAIGGKMREILTEAVSVLNAIEGVDFKAVGKQIDDAMKRLEAATSAFDIPTLKTVIGEVQAGCAKFGSFESLGEKVTQMVQTIESHSSGLSSLSSRVAALEQKPAAAPAQPPAPKAPAPQAGADSGSAAAAG